MEVEGGVEVGGFEELVRAEGENERGGEGGGELRGGGRGRGEWELRVGGERGGSLEDGGGRPGAVRVGCPRFNYPVFKDGGLNMLDALCRNDSVHSTLDGRHVVVVMGCNRGGGAHE